MYRTALLLAVAALAAACTKDSQATANSKTELPQDGESRLARLEKRIDKIQEVLEKVLPPKEADPEVTYAVTVDPLDPVEGPADAKVTIVEGYEFACPYCWMANPVIEQLRAEFPNDVRVVSKYFVIHPQAVPAGLAVCAANQQGKYTELKNAIWAKAWNAEGEVNNELLGPESMEAFASELGLDLARFKADMAGEACRGWLEQSRDSMTPVGTTGTPAFYINGKQTGLDRPEAMKRLIADALATADKAIAGGVKQADFYATEIVGKGEKKVEGWFDLE